MLKEKNTAMVMDDKNEKNNAGSQQVEEKIVSTGEQHEVIMLPLATIQRDDEYIVRGNLNAKGVSDYAELFTDYREAVERKEKAKYPFPPIVVWFVNGLYILLCGQHRFEAALKAGLTEILARVFDGSSDEAFLQAFKDNVKHGVRMTDNDKKVAAIKALKRFPNKSLEFFVKELGGSKTTLSVLRNELYDTGQLARPDEVIGEDGKTYTRKPRVRKKQSDADIPAKCHYPSRKYQIYPLIDCWL